MAVLTSDERAAIAAQYQADQSRDRETTTISRIELQEVIGAIDDLYDGFRTNFLAALPESASKLTLPQLRSLLLRIMTSREEL